MDDKILLVEGQGDVDFFEALLRKMNRPDIAIKLPKNFGLATNTVSHFPSLIDLIISKQLGSKVQHFGIVADADRANGGGGFANRWNQITANLAKRQYRIPSNPPKLPCLGSIFRHSELPSVGLWLMPDHKNDGMLEDLIYRAAKKDANQEELLKSAETCVAKLPVKLFSPRHHTKAVVYSWLAWQKRPGQTLDITVNGDLIDLGSKSTQGFIQWLGKVF